MKSEPKYDTLTLKLIYIQKMAIIKCPECGHEVSDAADRCPNCGVGIAGNIKTCPDCGRVVLKNTAVCPSCGAKLDVAEQQAATEGSGNKQYSNVDPYAPRASHGKKKRGPLIAVIIVVALVAAGVAAYVLIDNAREARGEQQAYEEAIASTDTAAYNQYLAQYPDGVHADEVKKKLDELTSELREWKDACVNNLKSGFVAFLSNHPGSPMEQACKDKIDSLDYEDAVAANTVEALQMYVSVHPEGKYVDQALLAQKTIGLRKVQPSEAAQVKDLCSRFFAALGNKDDATLSATTAAVIDNFLNKRNATHADVMKFAEKLSPAGSAVSFATNGDYKISKEPTAQGDEPIYNVAFSVDESNTAADGESRLSTYFVTAKVNAQMKIISLGMRRVEASSEE